MIRVVAYVPPGIRGDNQFARECIDHAERRGYQNGGIYCDVDDVRRALHRGAALVIFARPSHRSPDLDVPSEFVGEETVRLSWLIPPCQRLVNRRPRPNTLASPGEKTVDNARPASMRPRNDRAAQLVEETARRLGFPPADPPTGWGSANY